MSGFLYEREGNPNGANRALTGSPAAGPRVGESAFAGFDDGLLA